MPEQSDSAWHPSRGLTLYGRKPALEALQDPALTIHCLHLAESNRPTGIIAQIIAEAERRGAVRFPVGPGSPLNVFLFSIPQPRPSVRQQ